MCSCGFLAWRRTLTDTIPPYTIETAEMMRLRRLLQLSGFSGSLRHPNDNVLHRQLRAHGIASHDPPTRVEHPTSPTVTHSGPSQSTQMTSSPLAVLSTATPPFSAPAPTS